MSEEISKLILIVRHRFLNHFDAHLNGDLVVAAEGRVGKSVNCFKGFNPRIRIISYRHTLPKLYLPIGRESFWHCLNIVFMDKAKFLKKLGANVAKIRKQKGYSQDRLYLEAGFSRGTLSKIENGLTSPEVYTLARIAEVLDIPIRKLVEFE